MIEDIWSQKAKMENTRVLREALFDMTNRLIFDLAEKEEYKHPEFKQLAEMTVEWRKLAKDVARIEMERDMLEAVPQEDLSIDDQSSLKKKQSFVEWEIADKKVALEDVRSNFYKKTQEIAMKYSPKICLQWRDDIIAIDKRVQNVSPTKEKTLGKN